MITSRVEKQIAVYEAGTPSKGVPDSYTSEKEARRLCADGVADRINHGKAIRMRRDAVIIRAGSIECHQDLVAKYGEKVPA
jgi:hypothetical protein